MPEKYCKPCQELGHLCRAVTDVDDEPLCAFCQDGEECPVSRREKEVAARFGKAAAGRAAVAVAPAKVKVPKEVSGEKTMEAICATPNCGKAEHHRGRCANQGNKKRFAKDRGTPRKIVAKPANTDESVTVRISAGALDAWWSDLSLEQKAGAFSFSMCGAE